MTDKGDVAERAKEMLVYGPIGLALYLRDTAPSFLKLFVARGRNELDQRRREVGEQLGQARSTGESAAADHAPAVLRIVSEGIQAVRERAEDALGALGVLAHDGAAVASPPEAAAQSTSRGLHVPADDPPGGPETGIRGDTSGLAIADYDDLSASQVVDRLDGLDADALEAIRAYEAEHRARNTILGKIANLSQSTR